MADQKQCRACGDMIPAVAVLCKECKSYQDARRFLSTSTTTLALLTALVSVSGGTLSALFESHWFADSSVSAKFSFNGGVFLSVANTGTRPARIDSYMGFIYPLNGEPISESNQGARLPLYVKNAEIPAGAFRLERLIVEPGLITSETIFSELQRAFLRLPRNSCQVYALINNFRGGQTEVTATYHCFHILMLLYDTSLPLPRLEMPETPAEVLKEPRVKGRPAP